MDALCPLVESSTDTAHDRLTLGAILRGNRLHGKEELALFGRAPLFAIWT